MGIGAVLLVALGVLGRPQRCTTEQGPIFSRAMRYFKGSELPAGFASGNGRIEATEYDIATKRAGRIATIYVVAEGDIAGGVLAWPRVPRPGHPGGGPRAHGGERKPIPVNTRARAGLEAPKSCRRRPVRPGPTRAER